ncbi:hypothetical protein [Conexibacter woesei]|uniref:Secreted protein n=1 Tax=Conexibacter woesei (strain DSM 14684 / CCUG 47730 / CIP 108061 / JCM 11494 / NBRC 100937 / ID131577) TaxID=469383 RepID=D3FCV3_CONWI|nr:hypothetical protein [Conexibacter woesei]ADB51465.1 hypothetical protein Cwoe_3046 [Conexibacter woesei DSM 14684]
MSTAHVTDHTAHHGHAAHHGDAVAQEDLRVAVAESELTLGQQERLAFRIERSDGETVRDYDVSHERQMHLIVVRSDLTGFQHLHPELAGDGTWSTPITLSEPGGYRLFADFSSAGGARTLTSDLRVDGAAELVDLPAPAPVATSDGGDRVELERVSGRDAEAEHATQSASAGAAATLRFAITRDGKRVDVEPYLGASGHLVALREGDLAFLHVHPSGDGVEFDTVFPTAGRYRLFLQYQVGGRVQTVAFTQVVK